MHTPESRRRAWEKMVERRKSWLSKNGPCKLCGSWEYLEVDHIDPSTKKDHKVWSWKEDRMLEELSKCQVLCKKCHHEVKHFQKRGFHGTQSWYTRRKCRCELCVEWSRERDKKRYRRLIPLR